MKTKRNFVDAGDGEFNQGFSHFARLVAEPAFIEFGCSAEWQPAVAAALQEWKTAWLANSNRYTRNSQSVRAKNPARDKTAVVIRAVSNNLQTIYRNVFYANTNNSMAQLKAAQYLCSLGLSVPKAMDVTKMRSYQRIRMRVNGSVPDVENRCL